METMSSEGELSSGYKIVPWSSWEQWDFVREGIFSDSPDAVAAALRRISAWRSRGCLPIPIDVTAAFVEIQQKDPFFRKEPTDDVVTSEEMLSMLYSMAIMRLVNGFVEQAHKRTGRSISQLADAVGIPRVLVDIRHESSHRNLPSLRLVRLACIKALDFLKSNYWEPQKCAIRDVRIEIRSRLREMAYCLKTKHVAKPSSEIKMKCAKQAILLRGGNKLSSQIVGKLQSSKSNGAEKQISKVTKIIARLYSAYPLEVVSVLLEFFELQTSAGLDIVDVEHSENDELKPLVSSVNYLKTIINKLACKNSRLLLSILKAVLEMIEAKQVMEYENGECYFLSSQHSTEKSGVRNLCSLFLWLLENLKALNDSGHIDLIDKIGVLSVDKHAVPRFSLKKLLRKCLNLSIIDDKYFAASVVLLAEMVGESALKERLKKHPLLSSENCSTEDDSITQSKTVLLHEEALAKKEAEKLESLKQQAKKRKNRIRDSTDDNAETNSTWTLASSWIPCPIGMVPCSFSSTAILPVLDMVHDQLEDKIVERNDNQVVNDQDIGCSDWSDHAEPSENEHAVKKFRPTTDDQNLDFPESTSLMVIDGIWNEQREEELLSIHSTIRIPL
ncbi:uncharacterized protein [Typha angustifolia]|uniref:uncharacterized protein n=1 Tax=Typha angustifolia TaxID=59011 RepID=UPI003C2F8931